MIKKKTEVIEKDEGLLGGIGGSQEHTTAALGAHGADVRLEALLLRERRTVIVFFFSSRRRHTSSDRDWSSDVCSSDLAFQRGQVRRVSAHFGNGHLVR